MLNLREMQKYICSLKKYYKEILYILNPVFPVVTSCIIMMQYDNQEIYIDAAHPHI